MIDWDDYPNFKPEEFACKHTNECHMKHEFMFVLQMIRNEIGKPIFISSGYRSPEHPVEKVKDRRGEHTHGLAADIICHGKRALDIIFLAQQFGIHRIGIHQKGNVNGRYIHLGMGDKFHNEFPVAIWTY